MSIYTVLSIILALSCGAIGIFLIYNSKSTDEIVKEGIIYLQVNKKKRLLYNGIFLLLVNGVIIVFHIGRLVLK